MWNICSQDYHVLFRTLYSLRRIKKVYITRKNQWPTTSYSLISSSQLVCYTADTLQMKGPWEPNTNVWFPFMYSYKWNCYFQNRIIMFCFLVPTFIYLWEIYIYFLDRSAYSAAENMWSDPGNVCINRLQTHECGNWDWGRAIPRKGVHNMGFSLRCSD